MSNEVVSELSDYQFRKDLETIQTVLSEVISRTENKNTNTWTAEDLHILRDTAITFLDTAITFLDWVTSLELSEVH